MPGIIDLEEQTLPSDCYVFKHSTRCPVSTVAANAVRNHEFDMDLYWINVVEQRELSNWVSSEYSVKHESPQLLRILNGGVEKVWNHGEIREDTL